MNSTEFTTKTPKLRSAVAAAILLAAGGTASADPVSLKLSFNCPLPTIGNAVIVSNISSDMPAEMAVDTPTGAFPINTTNTVDNNVRVGLRFAQVSTVEGTANAGSQVNLADGSIVKVPVALTIPNTPVPTTSGGFAVPADGATPADLELGVEGPATITVETLELKMRSFRADGSQVPGAIGDFTAPCTRVASQPNVLHSFTVVKGTEPPVDTPADIEVSTTEIAFGNVQSGTTATQTFTISNEGDLPLAINGLSIEGADAAAFSQTSNCSSVAGGASCDVTVTYFPSGNAEQGATLVIASSDTDEASVPVTLSGKSVEAQFAEIVLPESPLNFGNPDVGTTVEQTLTFGNTGSLGLTINNVSISGANASDFQVVNNGCLGVVAQDASCDITLSFTPGAEGARAAQLVVESNSVENASASIELTGTGKGEEPDFIVPIDFTFVGLTQVGPQANELPLSGEIFSMLNFTTSMFTADLQLDNATAHIPVLGNFLNATAHVEFEPVGETTGSLVDGILTANSKMYINLPKVTVKFFGFDLKIGGGDQCRTSEVVDINLATPEGEQFGPATGGTIEGIYDLPKLEKCGLLTSLLSSFMSGPDNPIALTLTPVLPE